jgi:hypothetical protein
MQSTKIESGLAEIIYRTAITRFSVISGSLLVDSVGGPQ